MPQIKEYISKLPAKEKKIASKIHAIITGMLPEAVVKFTYGVPHYYGHARICFL